MFLWLRTPDPDDERLMEQLVERSLLTMPGSYLGRRRRGASARGADAAAARRATAPSDCSINV